MILFATVWDSFSAFRTEDQVVEIDNYVDIEQNDGYKDAVEHGGISLSPHYEDGLSHGKRRKKDLE